jgi:prepilin-type N-terminal cleavage/methylation domain-containing protein
MILRTPPRRSRHAAFTLVEIVLVIAIIAVLGAAAIYKIKGTNRFNPIHYFIFF